MLPVIARLPVHASAEPRAPGINSTSPRNKKAAPKRARLMFFNLQLVP
jgi:hypothetical protein